MIPPPPHPGSQSGLRPRLPRVLVVDDQPRVAGSPSAVLSPEFDVRSTGNPHEALAWLRLKVAEQMKTALARAEATRRFHRERAEFRRRSSELAA